MAQEPDHWIRTNWKYTDLEGKRVEFTIPYATHSEQGVGTFMCRQHGETGEMEIFIRLPLSLSNGQIQSVRYCLTERGASQIQKHPNPQVADFRL